MAILAHPVIIVGIALVLLYLLIRFNSLWIYKLLDRTLKNDRDSLPQEYELPKYFKLNKSGEVDTSARWPGWDGWYFSMLPEDRELPIKMVRASLMTGLYGLDRIDDYELLASRGLSTFKALEYLSLVPVEEETDGKKEKRNCFSHYYLPKSTDLTMNHRKLDVAISGTGVNSGVEAQQYGKISGAWPHYRFQFKDSGVEFDIKYEGEKVVWWADAPRIFTYFATFGEFDGQMLCKVGDKKELYTIKGVGCFEHGFARKPFNFDIFWLPIRLLKKIAPSFKPVRYHYELFFGDDGSRGGFMHARGFGVDFRNRGGLHLGDTYIRINSVKIEYFDVPEPDLVDTHGRGSPTKFYRKWRVEAATDDGILEYTGVREWLPAPVASNMFYYYFEYKGMYKGQEISGRGYGEYLHI
ncbi:hypothetical protein ACFL6S_33030 [Candidatus Poribacteria bacterium]